jgi:hypothetical protein
VTANDVTSKKKNKDCKTSAEHAMAAYEVQTLSPSNAPATIFCGGGVPLKAVISYFI